jgi:hypothetical protein
MADIEYFDDGPNGPRGGPPSGGFGVVNWIGAGCSLALVLGLGVWGVQLTLRDVADVPVIRALEGPMRVQPDDPGGDQAAYQGLSVNSIKAGGEAAPAPDSIVLAPPPVALDTPLPALQVNASAGRAATATDANASTDMFADEDEEEIGVDIGDLAAQLSAGLAPLEGATQVATAGAVPATVPGVSLSARPMLRPASLRADAAAPVTAAVAVAVAAQAVDANPDAIPSGARLVQLGAFDTPEIARQEWDRLYGLFGDYLEGKQRLVQEATSGGRNFYRLRVVGFDDANDARRFCSAFLARSTACIPVTAR